MCSGAGCGLSSVYYQEKTKWVTVYLCVFCLWIEQDSLDDPLFEHGPLTVYIICLKTSFPMLTLEARETERKRRRKRQTEVQIVADRFRDKKGLSSSRSSHWFSFLPKLCFIFPSLGLSTSLFHINTHTTFLKWSCKATESEDVVHEALTVFNKSLHVKYTQPPFLWNKPAETKASRHT